MNEKKIKVLITGGAGYVGKGLSNFLTTKNFDVSVIDNLSSGTKFGLNKKIKFYKYNLSQKNKIINIIKNNKYNIVIHLAAKIDARESNKNKSKYLLNNYLYSKMLLDIIIKYKIKNFIFASSAAIYGDYKKKYLEHDKKKPINYYGISKLKFENYLKKKNINFAILRFFNIGGAIKAINCGRIKNIGIFKILCNSIYLGNKFNIYGNQFNTKDGYSIRDYIHVKDVILIIHKSINYLISKNKNLIINCGSGKGTSLGKIIKYYQKFTSNKLFLKLSKNFKGDPSEVVSNISKMKKKLKYIPKYSNLNKIAYSSYQWENYLSHLKDRVSL